MVSTHCFLPFKETFSIADKQFKTGNKLSSAKVQCVTNPFSDWCFCFSVDCSVFYTSSFQPKDDNYFE